MDQVLFGIWLTLVILAIGLAVTKRVIVAWMAYWTLRRRPEFSSPEGRAQLLQITKDYADGKLKGQ